MKRRIAGLSALIAIGIFSVLFQSCGGGGKISDSTAKASVAAARTGYVEGYIYTTAAAAQKHGAANAGADSYVPFATATVKVTCGSDVKTGATDSDGYYKIEKTPVGDCTLTATKAGYASVEKQVTVAENEGTKASYTTDGRILGRVLLEDNTTHSGTTVKITYGDQVKTVQTNEKAFYALPDVSGANAKNVLIEATNSCEAFLPASSTMQIDSNRNVTSAPTVTLPRLFKYKVTTAKNGQEGYSEKQNYVWSDTIHYSLTVQYRGSAGITIKCSSPAPWTHVKSDVTGGTYTMVSLHPMGEDVQFSPNSERSWGGSLTTGEDRDPLNDHSYKVYITICGEDPPPCLGTDYESLMTPAEIKISGTEKKTP